MTTILIADDDDNVRYALSKLLRKAGYHVLEAQNGAKRRPNCSERPCPMCW